MVHIEDGLSLMDKFELKFFGSVQQKICERYAAATPEKYRLGLRRQSIWESYYGYRYIVTAYNMTKYVLSYGEGRYVHSSDDIWFGHGVSISDAFADLLRHILKYEKIEENHFNKLFDVIKAYEKGTLPEERRKQHEEECEERLHPKGGGFDTRGYGEVDGAVCKVCEV